MAILSGVMFTAIRTSKGVINKKSAVKTAKIPQIFLLSGLLCGTASATLVLPASLTNKGWKLASSTNGNSSDAANSGSTIITEWQDPSGECTILEESHKQAFPIMKTSDKARTFALRLRKALAATSKQVKNVIAQPINLEGNVWSVLTAYSIEGDTNYAMTQLFTHDNGKLRTYTGRSPLGKRMSCVADMHKFLRHGISKSVITAKPKPNKTANQAPPRPVTPPPAAAVPASVNTNSENNASTSQASSPTPPAVPAPIVAPANQSRTPTVQPARTVPAPVTPAKPTPPSQANGIPALPVPAAQPIVAPAQPVAPTIPTAPPTVAPAPVPIAPAQQRPTAPIVPTRPPTPNVP